MKAMVITRTPSVGRTFFSESIALIRVREPPYMLSAVTETSPKVAKISTTPRSPGRSRPPLP